MLESEAIYFLVYRRIRIGFGPESYFMSIYISRRLDPLQTTLSELGIVSGRVAMLRRVAEIKPVFHRFDGLVPSLLDDRPGV